MAVREIAGIQHLDAGLMVAIKWSSRVWATSVACFGCIREPNSQVIDLDWTSGRITGCIVGEHHGRGSNARRLDEGLFIENASEIPDAPYHPRW